MNWEKCLTQYVKKVIPDEEKINSIRKMSKIRLKILNEIKLDDETASIIATDYYEVIKELLTALLLKHGLKSDNHECLISFFKEKYSDLTYETGIIHQLKEVRNRAAYDGVFVKKDYVEFNKLEFNHIINLLEDILDKD